MATLAAVRGAIEDTLSAGGIRITNLGDVIHPPAASVSWNRLDYSQTMANGLTHWDMRVRVYVSLASNRAAIAALDDFCDPTTTGSIKQLLEADGTLGSVVSDTYVAEVTDPRVYPQDDGTQLLGVEFTVTVYSP